MNKLTREEIQALSDDELNWQLFSHVNDQPVDKRIIRPNYCTSLDAQFELAEKFHISLRAWGPEEPDEKLSMGAWKGNRYFCSLDKNKGTKRTGAEALLLAIQELEESK